MVLYRDCLTVEPAIDEFRFSDYGTFTEMRLGFLCFGKKPEGRL